MSGEHQRQALAHLVGTWFPWFFCADSGEHEIHNCVIQWQYQVIIVTHHLCQYMQSHPAKKQAGIFAFKENLSYFNITHSIRNIADVNWSTGWWSPDTPDTFLTTLMRYSATDALKGEGLQDGVDWLQGTIEVRVWAGQGVFNRSIDLSRLFPSVYK